MVWSSAWAAPGTPTKLSNCVASACLLALLRRREHCDSTASSRPSRKEQSPVVRTASGSSARQQRPPPAARRGCRFRECGRLWWDWDAVVADRFKDLRGMERPRSGRNSCALCPSASAAASARAHLEAVASTQRDRTLLCSHGVASYVYPAANSSAGFHGKPRHAPWSAHRARTRQNSPRPGHHSPAAARRSDQRPETRVPCAPHRALASFTGATSPDSPAALAELT